VVVQFIVLFQCGILKECISKDQNYFKGGPQVKNGPTFNGIQFQICRDNILLQKNDVLFIGIDFFQTIFQAEELFNELAVDLKVQQKQPYKCVAICELIFVHFFTSHFSIQVKNFTSTS
jgi:hypothetical protein